ncbi:Tudor/PWWP/MBT superfamily protein [Trifolium repens]|nr:Tudor/PWWP/MBT superfamily protein [Trifolium repens]
MDGLSAEDCAVGSLVWVRRRNGSWWPGQILSSDDLTSSHHLTSPRSGTPVKLLGREDASVDWYNLEKSKRVKPFRCGEFDGCIERAESAQGMPLKKREKYARREDAILHALELERQMLKKQDKLGTGQMGAAFRAKRSRCVYLPAESSDSLDYNENLSNIPITSSQLGGEYPYGSSFAEESESDSSETASIDSESDSSETELDDDEEMTIFSDTGHDAEEQESTSSEEPDELAISGDMPHLYRREPKMGNALSKWQFKGKRNNRNLGRRSVVAPDRRGVLYGADVEGQRSHLNHKRPGASFPYYRNDYSDAPDDSDQMFGSEDEYSPTPRGVAKGQNKTCHGVDWDEWPWEEQPALKGYWDFKGFAPLDSDLYHYDGRNGSMLVDVDIKVQTSYRKEPVPIVSVTSKTDGRSIIGHPIKIEALREGSTDNLFSAIDDFSNDVVGYEGNGVLPRVWTTARRTANFRVPRPHILSSNVDEDFSLDQERNIDYKKLNGGSSGHNASLWKKSGLNSVGPSIDKKSSKKGAKKVNLTSSQKTRTLSSLSIEDNLNRKASLTRSFYRTDKLTKPEVVACIPVKLVFSRLLEKINRPPLKASTNADVLNTGLERRS